MKRLSIFGLMLASAFALTNCSQEILPPVQENDVTVDESIKEEITPEEVFSIPFEVYANSATDEVETKTENDGNNTNWKAGDDINVYHSVHNANSYVNNEAFIIADKEKGLFGGGLKSPLTQDAYDWCFLYPYDDRPEKITATDKPVVNMGFTNLTSDVYVQKLTPGNKAHIAGENFPMYGHTLNVPADNNPKVQMKHMSAIVALKIVNQGDSKKENLANEKNETDKSSITINDITFAVPEYNSSAIKQTKIPIVGSFKVDPTSTVNSNSFTPVDDASSNSVSLDFTSTTIKPGGSATFYVAVRPFDVSNSTLGGSEGRTGLTLSITVNGSTRSVEIPADTKFEAGKVTTLRVPVKLSHPKKSDALETKQNVGYEFISWSNKRDGKITVNGEAVDAYILGEGKQGTLTISGEIEDLFNALPASFYVSYWKDPESGSDLASAMTVMNIDAEIDGTHITDYQPLKDAIKSELQDGDDVVVYEGWFDTYDLTNVAIGYVLELLSDGIPREDDFGLCLTSFIAPQTITFRGIVGNNCPSNSTNMLIMDEEPIHKNLNQDNINGLFNQKFPGATYEGLRDIINGEETPAAITTSTILYNTINTQFSKDAQGKDRKVSLAREYKIPLVGTKVTIKANVKFKAILDALFDSAETMRSFLPKLHLAITIGTYPYSSVDADYGTKGKPLTPDKVYNPLIFWGLDAWGNDDTNKPVISKPN